MAIPLIAGGIVAAGYVASKLPNLLKTAQAVYDAIPQLEDQVTVEIVGQPGSSKKTLYYLALAVANSLVRRFASSNANGVFLSPPTGMIMLEYDAADSWVRCTMRYKSSTAPVAVKGKATAGQGKLEELAVYAGPKCDVVGDVFNFTGTAGGVVGVPGIPSSSKSLEAPQLPFAQRTILTNCPQVAEPIPGFGTPSTNIIPTPNPKPIGDNRSRGAIPVPDTAGASGASNDDCCARSLRLVPLVFASLSDPGSYGDQVFRQPTPGPTGN